MLFSDVVNNLERSSLISETNLRSIFELDEKAFDMVINMRDPFRIKSKKHSISNLPGSKTSILNTFIRELSEKSITLRSAKVQEMVFDQIMKWLECKLRTSSPKLLLFRDPSNRAFSASIGVLVASSEKLNAASLLSNALTDSETELTKLLVF